MVCNVHYIQCLLLLCMYVLVEVQKDCLQCCLFVMMLKRIFFPPALSVVWSLWPAFCHCFHSSFVADHLIFCCCIDMMALPCCCTICTIVVFVNAVVPESFSYSWLNYACSSSCSFSVSISSSSGWLLRCPVPVVIGEGPFQFTLEVVYIFR